MDANGVETAGEWKNGERIKAIASLRLEPPTVEAQQVGRRINGQLVLGFLVR